MWNIKHLLGIASQYEIKHQRPHASDPSWTLHNGTGLVKWQGLVKGHILYNIKQQKFDKFLYVILYTGNNRIILWIISPLILEKIGLDLDKAH